MFSSLHLIHPLTLAERKSITTFNRIIPCEEVPWWVVIITRSTPPPNQPYKPITKPLWITLFDFPCLSSSWESQGVHPPTMQPTPKKVRSYSGLSRDNRWANVALPRMIPMTDSRAWYLGRGNGLRSGWNACSWEDFVGVTGLEGLPYPTQPLGNYHVCYEYLQKRFFFADLFGREEEYTQRIWKSKLIGSVNGIFNYIYIIYK